MRELIELVKNNQSFLIKRILYYAQLLGYSKYTSTLEEAWALSIAGLTKGFVEAIESNESVPEIEVDQDFSMSPISAFGILEARKHRDRGVSLTMFLSFIKYYRQAYIDLLEESNLEPSRLMTYRLWTNRFFDINEISYINEWTKQSEESVLNNLRINMMEMTNEKNKYLTIFESSSNPTFIINSKDQCININYAGLVILNKDQTSPGYIYYSSQEKLEVVKDILPWINDDYMEFVVSAETSRNIEKKFNSPSKGERNLLIKFHKMLDVSNRYNGTVIIIDDLTDYKKIEERLQYLSFHDQLTGLFNRTYMEDIVNSIIKGDFNPVGMVVIDIDGLKIINDNLGHAQGDALLVNASKILARSFRKSDIILRVGGDEFTVIMPFSDEKAVELACARVRENIILYNKKNIKLPLSVSIGWSIGNIYDNDTVTATNKEADDRMYKEKETNHKNFVEIFNERIIQ